MAYQALVPTERWERVDEFEEGSADTPSHAVAGWGSGRGAPAGDRGRPRSAAAHALPGAAPPRHPRATPALRPQTAHAGEVRAAQTVAASPTRPPRNGQALERAASGESRRSPEPAAPHWALPPGSGEGSRKRAPRGPRAVSASAPFLTGSFALPGGPVDGNAGLQAIAARAASASSGCAAHGGSLQLRGAAVQSQQAKAPPQQPSPLAPAPPAPPTPAASTAPNARSSSGGGGGDLTVHAHHKRTEAGPRPHSKAAGLASAPSLVVVLDQGPRRSPPRKALPRPRQLGGGFSLSTSSLPSAEAAPQPADASAAYPGEQPSSSPPPSPTPSPTPSRAPWHLRAHSRPATATERRRVEEAEAATVASRRAERDLTERGAFASRAVLSRPASSPSVAAAAARHEGHIRRRRAAGGGSVHGAVAAALRRYAPVAAEWGEPGYDQQQQQKRQRQQQRQRQRQQQRRRQQQQQRPSSHQQSVASLPGSARPSTAPLPRRSTATATTASRSRGSSSRIPVGAAARAADADLVHSYSGAGRGLDAALRGSQVESQSRFVAVDDLGHARPSQARVPGATLPGPSLQRALRAAAGPGSSSAVAAEAEAQQAREAIREKQASPAVWAKAAAAAEPRTRRLMHSVRHSQSRQLAAIRAGAHDFPGARTGEMVRALAGAQDAERRKVGLRSAGNAGQRAPARAPPPPAAASPTAPSATESNHDGDHAPRTAGTAARRRTRPVTPSFAANTRRVHGFLPASEAEAEELRRLFSSKTVRVEMMGRACSLPESLAGKLEAARRRNRRRHPPAASTRRQRSGSMASAGSAAGRASVPGSPGSTLSRRSSGQWGSHHDVQRGRSASGQ